MHHGVHHLDVVTRCAYASVRFRGRHTSRTCQLGGRGHEGQAAQRQTLLMVRGATLLSVRGKSPHNKSVVVLRAKSGGLKTVYTYSLLRAFVRYWKKP